MSDSTEDGKPVICRLCTSTKSGQSLIFGKEGEKRQLSKKIKECIHIQVQDGDTLSKSICQICISKVEDFHLFQQSCIGAQSLLEEETLRINEISEVTDAEVAEAERIVERLQADGSALSITPVCETKVFDHDQAREVSYTPNAFSITPVVRNSESSGDDDSQWDSLPASPSLPCLKNPSNEDYVLMMEETFKVDPSRSLSKPDNIEYSKRHDEHNSVKDRDVIEFQSRRRVVLPPMWDVFERSADKENVTHRRYVVSKSSFPCSLCGACVAFHRRQTVLPKKPDLNSQEHYQTLSELPIVEQEQLNNRFMTNIQDQSSNDLEQQLMSDLGVTNFSSQEVGMLDCPECGKLFPRRSSWKRHLRTHYEGRAFVCPVCCKGFNRKEHLSRHMMSHTGGRPFRCETCFKPFTRKEHLARHLACNVGCGSSATGLVSGMEQDYTVPRPYKCDVCHQTFVRKEHMLRHRKRAHLLLGYSAPPSLPEEDDGQPFSATQNPRSNIDDSTLDAKEMRQIHLSGEGTNEGPEQIEVEVSLIGGTDTDEDAGSAPSEALHKPLTGKGDLMRHPMQFHPQAASTEGSAQKACSRDEDDEADDESGSIRFALVHNPPAPVTRSKGGQHPCSICGKMFGRRYHLVRHRRTQHGVECVESGRVGRPPKRLLSFPHQSSTNSHLFRCTACALQFSCHSDFQNHNCCSNNNIISKKSGSRAVAEMAAKISDKLLKGKDNIDHVCQSCGEKFYNQLELDKHVETHVNDLMEGMLWT